jgi:uncharacterized repeat protein (TIGR02543 family)
MKNVMYHEKESEMNSVQVSMDNGITHVITHARLPTQTHCSLLFIRCLYLLFLLILFSSCPNPMVIDIVGAKIVTFETNGGSAVESQTVYRGYPVIKPDNPARNGYDFSGWFVDNETFTIEWNFKTVPEKNITLYAKWAVAGIAITVTGPVTGEIPVTTAQAGSTGYTCGPVTWTPNHSPFQSNKQYTATVTLTAESGYTFDGLPSATINGYQAVISGNTGTNVKLAYTFAKTDKSINGIAVTAQPVKLIYSHDETLELSGLVVTISYDDGTTAAVPFANFASKNISASPAHGTVLSILLNDGQTVVISLGSYSANTNAINVTKAPGAPVVKPTANSVTYDRITMNAVTAPANGQAVEYAISTASDGTGLSPWQSGTTFTGLNPDTTYYVYARSKENTTHDTGTANVSAGITTTQSGTMNMVYYWVDEHGALGASIGGTAPVINSNGEYVINLPVGQSVTFTANNLSASSYMWYLNGTLSGNTTSAYTFPGPTSPPVTSGETHRLGLFVNNGMWLNTNFIIKVQ